MIQLSEKWKNIAKIIRLIYIMSFSACFLVKIKKLKWHEKRWLLFPRIKFCHIYFESHNFRIHELSLLSRTFLIPGSRFCIIIPYNDIIIFGLIVQA